MYYYLIEIKNRIFISILSWGFLIALTYSYKNTLLYLYIKPSYSIMKKNKDLYFIYTNISELFYTYINMIITTTVPIFFSLIIYQIIMFLKPGLYKYEYKYIITYLKLLSTLLIINFNFFYFFFIPISFNFFFSFQNSLNNSQPVKFFFESKLNEYINFISYLTVFCILLSILTSIILYIILVKKTYKNYIRNNRKKIYFIFWTLTTIITPPDVFSQVIIGTIIIIMFEIYILLLIFKDNIKVTN